MALAAAWANVWTVLSAITKVVDEVWPPWPVALGSILGIGPDVEAPEEEGADEEATDGADEERDCRLFPFGLAERVGPPLAPGLGALGLDEGCPLLFKVFPPAACLEFCLRFS